MGSVKTLRITPGAASGDPRQLRPRCSAQRRRGSFARWTALAVALGTGLYWSGAASGAGALAAGLTSHVAPPAAIVVGSAAVIPAGVTDLGTAPAMARVALDVALEPRDPAALDSFVAAVSNPSSPLYRHYLKKGQFGSMFGATPSAIAAVSTALRRRGLAVGHVSANDLLLHVTTTVAGAERAFGVQMHAFRTQSGAVVDANTTAPTLPSAVAPLVQSVVGLDNLVQFTPAGLVTSSAHTTRPTALPAAPPITPPGVHAHLAAGQPVPCNAANTIPHAFPANSIARAYDFTPLYVAGDFGAGETIALFELAAFPPRDIATYQKCYGTHVAVGIKPVDGGNSSYLGDGESDSDIEDVIGLAPGLSQVLVYETTNSGTHGLDQYAQIQMDDAAQVVSTSWTLVAPGCEAVVGSGTAHSESNTFRTMSEAMGAQGQSIFAASGDSGAEGCNRPPPNPPQTQLAVTDPSSDPYVTGAGGTFLSNIGAPPAIPPSEVAWKGGGGGISSFWPMTKWQTGKGVINSYSSGKPCAARSGYCREVPDVSADAAPGTGYAVVVNNGWIAIGGTSLAAPTWAALVALINASSARCKTAPVGFLEPLLYKLATSTPTDFNDVTTGNNDACGCHSGTYPATAGYDMATGLGSPVGANLAQSMCGAAAPLWSDQSVEANNFVTLSPAVALSGHTLYSASINGVPAGSSSDVYYGAFNGSSKAVFSHVSYGGVAAQSAFPPAIAINGSTPVVAWTDFKSGDIFDSSLSGGKWSKPLWIGARRASSDNGPALASYGGSLFAVWKGTATNNLYFSSTSATSWTAPQLVSGASTGSHPAITFDPSFASVVISWRTTSGKLQFEVYSGLGFGGVATMPGLSSVGPALAVLGTQLYAAWRGTGTNHQIWFSADSPGKLYGGTWSAEKTIPQALTPYYPALAAAGPTLVVAWTGNVASPTSDAPLWYTSSDQP